MRIQMRDVVCAVWVVTLLWIVWLTMIWPAAPFDLVAQLDHRGVANNMSAKDANASTITKFLTEDKTDDISYYQGHWECLDYAITVHNNAERRGLRCGIVIIYFNNSSHALNAWSTENGMMYTDCTIRDMVAIVRQGEPYVFKPFSPKGYLEAGETINDTGWITGLLGVINKIETCW